MSFLLHDMVVMCVSVDLSWTVFQCPAIDYTRHTLDGAACLLNSNKYFPSR
ncbi:PHOCN protein, partial [Atractosteus spatula]|nr:PHOCN protein [Atractosteus spatula]